jgi:hypothetical protein
MVLPCLFSFIFKDMENRGQISWLDYTLMNNPSGVMKVVSDYGFVGIMQPKSLDEIKLACLDIMDMYGDEGTIAILKAHPEYPVFTEILRNQNTLPNNFLNATGTLSEKLTSFISKNPINQAFVALSVFVVIYYILSQIKKQ